MSLSVQASDLHVTSLEASWPMSQVIVVGPGEVSRTSFSSALCQMFIICYDIARCACRLLSCFRCIQNSSPILRIYYENHRLSPTLPCFTQDRGVMYSDWPEVESDWNGATCYEYECASTLGSDFSWYEQPISLQSSSISYPTHSLRNKVWTVSSTKNVINN